MTSRKLVWTSFLRIAVAAALLPACGGGGDGNTEPNPPPSDPAPASIAVHNGGGQTQRINTALATAPSVIVKDGAGVPVAGVSVHFAVAGGDGAVTGADVTTDAQGVARVGSWIMGPSTGEQRLRATAQTTSLTADISATARYPRWTVAVYMAADNNLAFPGVQDIEEMEAATRDPEIQVVVQAEFNAEALAKYGCTGPSCIGLTSFNTFRYVVSSSTVSRIGPDGEVTSLSNRNMADPAQLTEFIQWARATAPSERLVLVPWNHGGGYTGLLEDATSSPGVLMGMAHFRSALQAAGGAPIDIIDFDMCLMGAYETLISLQGLARYAVFSEEVTPGAGNDYTRLLNGMRSVNLEDGSAIAGTIADAFYVGFEGASSSITISAYDLTAFAAFDQALSSLASHLKSDLTTYGPLTAQAGSNALRFSMPELTDVLNFADSLEARVADATIRADITALRMAATATTFRLRNRFRNGNEPGFGGTGDVTRASGLHVLLPDVTSAPTMGSVGPRSLNSYLGIYGSTGWGQFLAAYLATPAVADVTDLGAERLETYLAWSHEAQASGVDIDLWVLEPDGTVASPYFGSVSPNGTLTNDSYVSGYPVEGYLTNRFVMNGTYIWYAFLVDDPQPAQPLVNLVYRYGDDPFVSIFGDGPFPQLTGVQSILADPDPTFGEANVGAYSDFVAVANATFGPAGMIASARVAAPRLFAGSQQFPNVMRLRGMPGVRPTQRQAATLRRLLETRRSGVRPAQARGLAQLRPARRLVSELVP